MKNRLLITILFIVVGKLAIAQNDKANIEGTISHITSSSIYMRFSSTTAFSPGDTIYFMKEGQLMPAIIVTSKSSLSVVGTPVSGYVPNLSDKVFFNKTKSGQRQTNTEISKPGEIVSVTKDTSASSISSRQQKIGGKISAASLSTFTDTPSADYHRLRYTLSMQAKNIGGSRVSLDSYISFIHKTDYWDEIKSNIFNGLKIYNLAVSYEATDNLTLAIGRKINPKLSSMGAVDGIQAEYRINSISIGAIAGERPNYQDYRFNFIRLNDSAYTHTSLFQYGAYISHERIINKGNIQTTLSFVDQKNGGSTDRRFTYIQHSNSIVKNLFFFGSAEFDLYRIVNEAQESSPKLSNLYVSGRYRILRNLSVSLSYSARKNIVYYESFKNFIDRYIENEMQQGYSARINYSPLKRLSLGASGGLRNRIGDSKPSKNAYIYASYNQLPGIDASLTLSATLLETGYLTGNAYAVSLSRDFFKNKLNTTLTYRYQDYKFTGSEHKLIQHTPEIGFNWFIVKKFSLGLSYEATLEDTYLIHRVYVQLTKRF